MSYALVIVALWPWPGPSPEYVSTTIHWPYFSLEQCELRKVREQRQSRYLVVYSNCKVLR